jgi:hypothetical protein
MDHSQIAKKYLPIRFNNLQELGGRGAHNAVYSAVERKPQMDIESFNIELAPEGLLEQILADEIIGAATRLRRCADAEGEAGDTDNRIERIRAAAHSVLHRSINQFRRLQTERACREVVNAVGDDGGIADYKEVTAAANNYERLKQGYRRNQLASICEMPEGTRAGRRVGFEL